MRTDDAVEFLLRVAAAGVTYHVTDGTIYAGPPERITKVMAARFKQYKPEILELHAEWIQELREERIAMQATGNRNH